MSSVIDFILIPVISVFKKFDGLFYGPGYGLFGLYVPWSLDWVFCCWIDLQIVL